MMTATRTLDCPTCQTPVTFETESRWTPGRRIACPRCGTVLADHAQSEEYASERVSLEDAERIAARYSYDQIMAIAHRAYHHDGEVSPAEKDVLAAFVRLRAAQQGRN